MGLRLIGEKPEEPWLCQIATDGHINFCIWILQIDGLSVPPFNHHPDGDHSLRNQGLDAESWQVWLARVLATKDPYLNCHVPNIQAKLAEEVSNQELQINSCIELGMLPPDYANQLYWSEFRASKERQLIRSEQLYQQAVKRLGDIPRNVTPPELWHGAPAVREGLRELWQRRLLINEKASIALFQSLEANSSAWLDLYPTHNNLPWSDLAQYQSRLKGLQFYDINYFAPVEYIVHPISILMSQLECDVEDLRSRTLRAVERLINLSN